MNWLSLFFSAAHAQVPDPNDLGGYVPAKEIVPIQIPYTPWRDIYDQFLFGLKEGAYMASQVIPILMLLLVSYAIIRWMNRKFRQSPNDIESSQTRIINNTGDLVHRSHETSYTMPRILPADRTRVRTMTPGISPLYHMRLRKRRLGS